MKFLKHLGLAALAAMALTAFLGASSASATTLEVGGVTKNEEITLTASVQAGTSAILSLTGGGFANTCTTSNVHGYTNPPYTTTKLTGTLTGHTAHERSTGILPSSGLNFSNCTRPVTVHNPGGLIVEHIAGTTNGTVTSEGAEVTSGSPIGTLTCTTPAAGRHIGTLTGATTAGNPGAHAKMDINAVINCGFLAPSAVWEASYIITSPTDLGISA